MPDKDYGKLADEIMPKKEKAERDCQGYLECYADGKNQTIDDCKPTVMKLLKEIDKLKAGSIEVGVGDIEKIIQKEVDKIIENGKSKGKNPTKKLAQAILNNLKEKE